MLSKDRERMAKYEMVMRTILSTNIRNLEAVHQELHANRYLVDAHRYHELVCIQGKVVSYMRKCFQIRAKEAQRIKPDTKRVKPFYILWEKDIAFTPQNQTWTVSLP